MKKKEKINWGLLSFIFLFCWCLKLGMHLDLKNQNYPNNLNTYQEMRFPPSYGCAFDLIHGSFSSPSFNNLDGDIR